MRIHMRMNIGTLMVTGISTGMNIPRQQCPNCTSMDTKIGISIMGIRTGEA